MQPKYGVFNAMRELGEFTVSGLVEASNLAPQTIRSVLSRCSDDWLTREPLKVETGRPGGQFTRYRLTPKGRSEIEAELAVVTSSAARSREHAEYPITLRTANDTLSRSLPEAKTFERRSHLLDMVRADLLVAHARIQADKTAGYNTDRVEADLENVARVYEFCSTGVIPEANTVQMKSFMLQHAADLRLIGHSWDPLVCWPSLRELAAQFQSKFKQFVASINLSQDQAAAFAARLRLPGASFIDVEARDLPYFGIAPTIYANGVLHDISTTHRGVRADGVRIFIPRLLEAIRTHQSLISTALERSIAEQLKLEGPALTFTSAASSVRHASDIYAPELAYAGR